mgnify:CR=1 FL=1
MNSLSQLRKLLAALVLACMAVFMLPACSSTDEETTSSSTEASSDTSGGDSGLPCDLDPGQPHCLEELQNK